MKVKTNSHDHESWFFIFASKLVTIIFEITKSTTSKDWSVVYTGEAFVDDTGLGVNDENQTSPSDSNHHLTITENFSTGGALNLQKCFWFLVSWQWSNGSAKLHTTTSTRGELLLTSGNNTQPKQIQWIKPTPPFRTLGVYLSPSGTSTEDLGKLISIATDYTSTITWSKLSCQESLTSFIQYLLPKLQYQPPLLSLSKKECGKLMTTILKALLPKLHVNRNTARSIIYGPEALGGLALPDIYSLQGEDKLQLFLGHLKLGDCTGQLIHIVLTYVQLLTGNGKLILNLPYEQFLWVEHGWVKSIWEFVSEINLKFMYPSQWLPSLPWEGAIYLMEFFQDEGAANKELETLNRCHKFLQVISLSDVTTMDGCINLPAAQAGEAV